MRTLVLGLLAVACSRAPDRDPCAGLGPVEPSRRVDVPALGLSIGAFGDVVRPFDGGVDVERRRTPRTVSALTIRRRAPGAKCPATSCALPGGGAAALAFVEAGGSGGPSAGLEGCLDLGGAAYAVTCVDQPGEWPAPSPDPAWCLPYIASVGRLP